MKPVLQALVLAEKIYHDSKTGMKVIAGTFNRVNVDALAAAPVSPPHVYISLTDVCDRTELQLQFVSLAKNIVLFQTTLVIPSKDRLATVEIITPLPPLPVSKPGTYAFEVVCDGEIIGSHRVLATQDNSSGDH